MTQHELYYSRFCKHSSTILEELNHLGMNKKFVYICIDKRVVKQNITYILNPDGSSFPLPPMINRVPVLLLKPNHEILGGNQILDYVRPQSQNISEEKHAIHSEPDPFALSGNSFGVTSDNYSFLDMGPSELLAQGNGGTRQMHSYVALDKSSALIQTPSSEGSSKSSYDMEAIQSQRSQELR